MLNASNWETLWNKLRGCTVDLSGKGEDALKTAETLQQNGLTVLTLSGEEGWIYDYENLDVEAARACDDLRDYMAKRPLSKFDAVSSVWESPCDVAVACEGGSPLTKAAVKRLASNGCKYFAGKAEADAIELIGELGFTYIR